jgi:uncharacterized DUF497 family protein
MKISYDPAKNERNVRERGLPFDLVSEMDWTQAIIVEDTRKDYGERWFRAFGYIGDRLFAVVFTPRPEAVHVISLRKANQREVKHHG